MSHIARPVITIDYEEYKRLLNQKEETELSSSVILELLKILQENPMNIGMAIDTSHIQLDSINRRLSKACNCVLHIGHFLQEGKTIVKIEKLQK